MILQSGGIFFKADPWFALGITSDGVLGNLWLQSWWLFGIPESGHVYVQKCLHPALRAYDVVSAECCRCMFEMQKHFLK